MNFSKLKVILQASLGILFCLIIIALLIINIESKRNDDLAKSLIIVNGEIIELKDLRAIYNYEFNGQIYTDSIFGFMCDNYPSYYEKRKIESEVIGFKFPVFKSTIDSNYILAAIRPRHFKSLGMQMPDSLNKVYEDYIKCGLWN